MKSNRSEHSTFLSFQSANLQYQLLQDNNSNNNLTLTKNSPRQELLKSSTRFLSNRRKVDQHKTAPDENQDDISNPYQPPMLINQTRQIHVHSHLFSNKSLSPSSFHKKSKTCLIDPQCRNNTDHSTQQPSTSSKVDDYITDYEPPSEQQCHNLLTMKSENLEQLKQNEELQRRRNRTIIKPTYAQSFAKKVNYHGIILLEPNLYLLPEYIQQKKSVKLNAMPINVHNETSICLQQDYIKRSRKIKEKMQKKLQSQLIIDQQLSGRSIQQIQNELNPGRSLSVDQRIKPSNSALSTTSNYFTRNLKRNIIRNLNKNDTNNLYNIEQDKKGKLQSSNLSTYNHNQRDDNCYDDLQLNYENACQDSNIRTLSNSSQKRTLSPEQIYQEASNQRISTGYSPQEMHVQKEGSTWGSKRRTMYSIYVEKIRSASNPSTPRVLHQKQGNI